MRKLAVTENITLDGVIDMAEGWFDPLAEDVDQSDIAAANIEHREAADALLVGRNTRTRRIATSSRRAARGSSTR